MFDDREMNLKNLFFTVLLKWRWIILFGLIVAAVMPTYKYMSDKKAAKTGAKTITVDETSMVDVATAAQLYSEHDMLKSQIAIYDEMSESNLDFTNMRNIYVQYYIEEDDSLKGSEAHPELYYGDIARAITETADDLTQVYISLANDDTFLRDILEISESGMSEMLFRQFVVTTTKGHVFSIQLACGETANAPEVVGRIRNAVEKRSERLQFVRPHKLILVSSGEIRSKAQAVLSDKYNVSNQLYNVENWLTNIKKNISTDYMTYARYVADGEIKLGEKLVIKSSDTKVYFKKKLMVIGFAAGAFVGAFIFACLYIISMKLHMAEDISECAKLRVFEVVEAPRKRKLLGFVDRLFARPISSNRRKLDFEKQIASAVSAISLYAEKNEVKNVAITGSLYDKIDEKVTNSLVSGLKAEGISAEVVDDIAYDKAALKTCAKADGVVILEQLRKSLIGEIERELNCAREYDINVIGAVVLE